MLHCVRQGCRGARTLEDMCPPSLEKSVQHLSRRHGIGATKAACVCESGPRKPPQEAAAYPPVPEDVCREQHPHALHVLLPGCNAHAQGCVAVARASLTMAMSLLDDCLDVYSTPSAPSLLCVTTRARRLQAYRPKQDCPSKGATATLPLRCSMTSAFATWDCVSLAGNRRVDVFSNVGGAGRTTR